MILIDTCTRAAFARGRCAKIPTPKHPEEARVISAGRSDFQHDGWSRFFHRVHADNSRAHLQWPAIHPAELANLQHVQPFPGQNQMRTKRSIPRGETNALRFPQTTPALRRA